MKKMSKDAAPNEKKVCCICGKTFYGWGNNPYPVVSEGECCDMCNLWKVLPKRMELYVKYHSL